MHVQHLDITDGSLLGEIHEESRHGTVVRAASALFDNSHELRLFHCSVLTAMRLLGSSRVNLRKGDTKMAIAELEETLCITAEEVRLMNAYWRGANYLSVGQIYLYDNPLLREPLTIQHVKPHLIGHWETTPGLNFIYIHLNRLIKRHDLNAIYIMGPGHGGPGAHAKQLMRDKLIEHKHYIRKHGDDIPEIRDWRWPSESSEVHAT